MSKLRSGDMILMQNPNSGVIHPQDEKCEKHGCIPVEGRFVIWQWNWPQQDEVPHAGTKWRTELNEVEIITGIPYIDRRQQPFIQTTDGLTRLETLKTVEIVSGKVVLDISKGGGWLHYDPVAAKNVADGSYKLIKVMETEK